MDFVCFLVEESSILNVGERELLNGHKDVSSKKWKLIYRASTHGDEPGKFYEKCDQKAPILVVIQSKSYNHVFGAFSHTPFDSEKSGHVGDPQFKNWIFQVRFV